MTRVRQRDGTIREEIVAEGSRVVSESKEPLPAYLEEGEKGFATLAAHVFDGAGWVPRRRNDDSKSSSTGRTLSAGEGSADDGTGGRSERGGAPMSGKLTLVTYNVWFAKQDQIVRAQGLADVVAAQRPDIVCLQEVTAPFLKCLLAQEWVREGFVVSDNTTGTTCIPYGVIMLVRKGTAETPWLKEPAFTIHYLPSNMGRRAVFATLAGGRLRVGTAHLESLDNQAIRIAQLEVIGPLLKGADNGSGGGERSGVPAALFAGDTNFSAVCEEASAATRLLAGAVDVWPAVHDPGSLISSTAREVQTMLHEKIGRLDKIYCRGGEGGGAEGGCLGLRPLSIELIGTSPCHLKDGGTCGIFPSDHAGVAAVFAVEGSD